ncbi:MAG TPA: efflux RND transporter periplasmic adaptor subunit [Candidatus Acidoferrales bacterium]|nr:efflux RND transporter periplasmic adaptor subunit [Candidatus Acidoferrales bacterium]
MSKRNLLIGIVALALLVAALVWFQSKPEEATEQAVAGDPNIVELSAEAQRNANLEVAEVSERPMERMLVATGVVAADQNREAHLRPLSRGVANRALVQLGDRVERGTPLLAYDNIEMGELSGEYISLLNELQRLQAQTEVSRRLVERARELLKVEGISQKEFELREAEYQQAQSAVKSKQAEMERVEEKLHRLGVSDDDLKDLVSAGPRTHRKSSPDLMRAPFAGVVTKYDVAPGELLGPEREVFTVVDTSVVWVLADIYERDLGKVREGLTARVKVPAYPDKVFTGKITYVGDVLDPDSRTAKLRCVVANPDGRLKLEMFATVEIPLPVREEAIVVPAAAVQVVGDLQVVFVQKGETQFEKRVIETGERSGDWIEIRSGLRPGERVVTMGAFYVKSALLKDQISGEE